MTMDRHAFWRDRPTLITGATGLLGGWLVRSLVDLDADVICLERDWVPQSDLVRSGLRQRVRVVTGDVRDQALLERALGEYEVVTVMHLAAQTIVGIANRNPISTFESNIAGTWSVLEACRRSPSVRQIVVASSDKAYGDVSDLPYREDTPLQGRHPYDVSKSCADLIAQSYAHTFDLPVSIARCGNFYGGGDLNWNRIVPGTIRSALHGEAAVIRSNGKYVRDYLYVEDGVEAYLLLAEQLGDRSALSGLPFNFSQEQPITVVDLVQRILQVMNSSSGYTVLDQTLYEIPAQYLNSERARTVLGWHPAYSLEQGLERTIAWYRAYFAERAEVRC